MVWFLAIQVVTLLIIILANPDVKRLRDAFLVAGLTTITYLFLYILSRGALGAGDVKFAFPLGLSVGWFAPDFWFATIFVSFLLAGTASLLGIISKQMDRKSRIAFGPFMFVSAFAIALFVNIAQ